MSKDLIERIRRARQSGVTVQGRSFTIRRPTDLEMHELNGKIDQRLLLVRFVVDWGVMPEMDLVPGGGPDPVPFSTDLWAEWIADHPELWSDLSSAVVENYKAHKTALEGAAKNLVPGSAA